MQIGEENSLSLDASGKPHIAYYASGSDPYLDQLRYAWFDGSAWNKMVVFKEPFGMNGVYMAGRNPVLMLDSGDRAGITFLLYNYETFGGRLYYIFQPPP
jgi:hypothetical protein